VVEKYLKMSQKRVFVCGVGMTKFEKPGRRENFDYPQMVQESLQQALDDSGLAYQHIQKAIAGYCYGDSTCGQRALYEFGLTGIPVLNVNNNCATGSSALYMAKEFIQGGSSDCVLAIGFEKMERGSLGSKWDDRTNPVEKHVGVLAETYGFSASPMAAQLFGGAGREHMEKFGTKPEHFAKIALKNHKHSVNNPLSQFRDDYTLEQILNSRMVTEPLTKLQCCPTSDGGAAAILCSEEFVNKHNLQDKAVELLALELTTDVKGVFEDKSMMKAVGYDMTALAAKKAFSHAGLKPSDVQVVELHDCFSANELITYEALGLCPVGKAGEMIDQGDNTYGGKYVVNPSGGLISKGHPLGATGLAQCFELCRQLRGECGQRQVKGATIALQHNLGLGGACVVGIYKKMTPLTLIKTSLSSSTSAEAAFKSDAVFTEIENKLNTDRETMIKKFKAVFCFELKQGDKAGRWIIDLKDKGVVVRGNNTDIKPGVTIKMKDEDCLQMMLGKLNAQTAFMQGKIKISGNMGLAMKLQQLKVTDLKAKM